MPSNPSSSNAKRFELPQLSFQSSSLTEGTDIPPPPKSPEPSPPRTPPAAAEKKVEPAREEEKANGSSSHNAQQGTNGSPTTTATAGTKRPAADDSPLSQAPSSRAGSIRRLFSRNLLNHAYAEGEAQSNNANNGPPATRQMSRSNGSILDEKKAKRGSGFFRRLRTGDNLSSPTATRRASAIYDHQSNEQTKPEVRGPPPPMIPELSALESKVDVNDGGSLGSDLFKNIN